MYNPVLFYVVSMVNNDLCCSFISFTFFGCDLNADERFFGFVYLFVG